MYVEYFETRSRLKSLNDLITLRLPNWAKLLRDGNQYFWLGDGRTVSQLVSARCAERLSTCLFMSPCFFLPFFFFLRFSDGRFPLRRLPKQKGKGPRWNPRPKGRSLFRLSRLKKEDNSI